MSQPRTDPRVVRSRAKVMRAAVEILREQGPAGLTVDEVIRRSGVARMTVYRHWPSRDDLLRDAFGALMATPTAESHPASHAASAGRPRSPDTAADRLTAAVVALGRELAAADWVDALPALLDHARRYPEQGDLRTSFTAPRRDRLVGRLAACRAEGLLAWDLDDEAAVAALLGPLVYRRLFTAEPITYLACVGLVEDLLRAHPGAARADS